MGLKKCKECGQDVSTSAKACPKCGVDSPTGGLGIGRAVLYGYVSEGWMQGAQVVDTFHATTPGCVAGTLVLTPRWSHPADAD